MAESLVEAGGMPEWGEHDGVENNENENISKILGYVKYLRLLCWCIMILIHDKAEKK